MFNARASKQVNAREIAIKQPVAELFNEFDMRRVFIHRRERNMPSLQQTSNNLSKPAKTGNDYLGLMRIPMPVLIGLLDAAAVTDASIEGY